MIHWIGEHIRYANFGIATLVLGAMFFSSIVRRNHAQRRIRRIWFWFFLFVMNYLYGTGDNIKDHIRLNPPAFIQTIILIGLFASILWHPEGDYKTPPDDGSMSTKFVQWLDRQVLKRKNR